MPSRKPLARIAALPHETLAVADAQAARGLGASRTAQLAADLRLTPEERVKAAEETARGTAAHGRDHVARVIGFERYEDYLDFKPCTA
jgi:hypothetical protein